MRDRVLVSTLEQQHVANVGQPSATLVPLGAWPLDVVAPLDAACMSSRDQQNPANRARTPLFLLAHSARLMESVRVQALQSMCQPEVQGLANLTQAYVKLILLGSTSMDVLVCR